MNQLLKSYISRLNSQVDWKQEPNRREKTIFFVAIFIFFLVFMRSCWYPSSKAVSDVKTEIELANEQGSYLSKVLNTKSAAEQDLLATNSAKFMEYSDWAKRLSDDPDSVLMTDISSPELLRGIKIGNISLQETASAGGVIKKGFKFSLLGPFSSVGNYLVRLEKLPLLMVIDEITIKEAGVVAGDTTQKVSADIGGTAYGWK